MTVHTWGLHFLNILICTSFLFMSGTSLFAQENSTDSAPETGVSQGESLTQEILTQEMTPRENSQENAELMPETVSETASETVVTAPENTVPENAVPENEAVPETVQPEAVVAHYVQVFSPQTGEAPLEAPIRWAKEVAKHIETSVQDYTCTVTKRERINGILGREEVMEAKIRHEPFSVYLGFKQPRRMNGREVIYVENANDGQILAHSVGFEALAGTLHLEPMGRLALKGNLHPITDMGVLNLARMLVKVGEENIQKDHYEVRYFDAKINDRDCVCVEVMNTNRTKDPTFYKAHVYVDMELNIPVKYMSWGWGNGCDFPLMEEYTYRDIRLNPGFTDEDFSVCNPAYNYRESRR